jgi:hypothetical protein
MSLKDNPIISDQNERPSGIGNTPLQADLDKRSPGFLEDIYYISRPELVLIGDSFLKFTIVSSIAGTFHMNYEIRTASGVYKYGQEELVVSAAQALARTQISVLSTLMPGVLSKVRVSTLSGAPMRGQTFVTVELQKSNDLLPQASEILISNYVTRFAAVSFPGSAVIASTDGAGFPYTLAVANPGAGSDFTLSIPVNTLWQLTGIIATLTTSAGVANRQTQFSLKAGTGSVTMLTGLSPVMTAGLIYNFVVSPTVNPSMNNQPVAQFNWYLTQPFPFPMSAGGGIQSITTGIQAGDQWSGIGFNVTEWILI